MLAKETALGRDAFLSQNVALYPFHPNKFWQWDNKWNWALHLKATRKNATKMSLHFSSRRILIAG